MGGALTRNAIGWVLDDPDIQVSRVCVGYQVTLLLQASTGVFELTIEGRFHRSRGDASTSYAADAAASLSWLGTLVREAVEELRIEADGTLRMQLGERGALVVAPDPDYEAWRLTGPEVTLVCPPGGGDLVEWRTGGSGVVVPGPDDA